MSRVTVFEAQGGPRDGCHGEQAGDPDAIWLRSLFDSDLAHGYQRTGRYTVDGRLVYAFAATATVQHPSRMDGAQ